MSRVRYVKGNIVKTTEGGHHMFAGEDIVFNSGKIITETGVARGVNFNSPCSKGVITSASKLVGKADRNPGYNFDGTPAEDMQYNDAPAVSASIKNDPVFKLNDATLQAYHNQLMTSLSVGNMETVALEMAKRFHDGTGGIYKSDILNKEIYNHGTFAEYHTKFYKEFKKALRAAGYDPNNISPIKMKLLNFSSFWDKATGLGITIHQVWSVKAHILNYTFNKCTNIWQANLVYTFYDHFGLDWTDIQKHGNDIIPQYHTGDFFKAWYILQHYRRAKPFIVEMERRVLISGNPNSNDNA